MDLSQWKQTQSLLHPLYALKSRCSVSSQWPLHCQCLCHYSPYSSNNSRYSRRVNSIYTRNISTSRRGVHGPISNLRKILKLNSRTVLCDLSKASEIQFNKCSYHVLVFSVCTIVCYHCLARAIYCKCCITIRNNEQLTLSRALALRLYPHFYKHLESVSSTSLSISALRGNRRRLNMGATLHLLPFEYLSLL